MKIVGVTGGIGSGKTTVCRIFELLRVPVFYADHEAKKLYNDPKIKSKVVKLFGKEILDNDGEIKKKDLAEIIFNDKKSLARINALIHPAVRQRFKVWMKQQKGAKYVIKEAAIMIESGACKYIDFLISVISPKSLRIKRVINRDKVNILDIKKRINEQLSDAKRKQLSDSVIVNDDKNSLIEQVLKVHALIVKK